MAPMRVIPTFDPLKNSHLRFGLAFESTAVQYLPLERSEKALRHRVVVGIADRSHRGHDTGLAAALAEGVARVLTATIRVMDHGLRSALRDRHVQRRQNQLGAQMRLHRPAHNAARIHIEHHRQIQKSGPRWNVGDVRYPQSIGSIGVELPIDEVNRTLRTRIGLRCDDIAAQRCTAKPGRSHQSCHTLAAHANSVVISELGMYVRRAVDASGAPMDRLDLPGQRQIRSISFAHRSIQPRIESTSRYMQQSAHDPDRVGGLVHLHEPEERFEVPLSVANQAAAFDRISRSSLSLRFSRRNRDSSSRSAVVNPPSPLPASRLSCRTHSEIDHAVGPNSFESDAGLRPLRAKSTICRLNSGVYLTLLVAISNTSISNHEVSTKPGQLHCAFGPARRDASVHHASDPGGIVDR